MDTETGSSHDGRELDPYTQGGLRQKGVNALGKGERRQITAGRSSSKHKQGKKDRV